MTWDMKYYFINNKTNINIKHEVSKYCDKSLATDLTFREEVNADVRQTLWEMGAFGDCTAEELSEGWKCPENTEEKLSFVGRQPCSLLHLSNRVGCRRPPGHGRIRRRRLN